MFVTQEDWETSPSVGFQITAEALGFEQRQLLGLLFLLQQNLGFFSSFR